MINNRSQLCKFWIELAELVRVWWQVDRIRISPNSGRLLRISPGDRILVQGRTIEVLSRTIHQQTAQVDVIYLCQDGTESTQLSVKSSHRGDILKLNWTAATKDLALCEDDVEFDG